jgi:hypothetical protein
MRKKVVTLVCDGCGKELEAEISRNPETRREIVVMPEGTAKVSVDIQGSENTSSLELCPDCTAQLPEGTLRKRPERAVAAKK